MLSCSGSLSRSMGSWFAETSSPLGTDSRVGSGASAGVDSREWVSIAVPDVPLDTDSGASCVSSSGVLGCVVFVTNVSVCGSRLRALTQPPVLCLVLRCVAVARVLGAVLHTVVAQGTPTRCGVCGSVRGLVAVVSVL